ncbi:MAG: hypothetical protein FGM27_09320 [Candidatus Omnitrophica bacterium]|nr:hypothetical protein [Candidatus Omnitrophota bacterium]
MRKPDRALLAVGVLVLLAVSTVRADEKDLSQSLAEITSRLDKAEQDQKQILQNQEKMMEMLQHLKVLIRRS